MVFLGLDKMDNKKARIVLIHNFTEMLSEEDKQNGVLLEEYAEPHEEGKITIPYWNYETSKVEFEFKDIPKTENEIFKERISTLEIALAEVIGK